MVNLNKLIVPQLERLAEEHGIKLSGNKPDKIKQIKKAGIDEKILEEFIQKHQKGKKAPKKAVKKTAKKPPKKIPQKSQGSRSKLDERVGLLEEQVKLLMKKISNLELKSTKGIKNTRKKLTKTITVQKISENQLIRTIRNVYNSIEKRFGDFVPISVLTEKIKDYLPWSTGKIHEELYRLFMEYKIDLQPGKKVKGQPLRQDGKTFVWFKLK